MQRHRRFRVVQRWSALLLILALLILSLVPLLATRAQSAAIESEDPRVQASGRWSRQAAAAASGGSYLFSSGAEGDVLAFEFSGPSIEVIYVAGPALGTLAIEIDGTVLRTVITTAQKPAYGQVARIDYLSDEPHRLKAYAQEGGVVALDAFIIPVAKEAPAEVSDLSGDTRATTCAPINAIHRVSVTEFGGQSGLDSFTPALSSDGRLVAFASASPLVAADGDAFNDVYVYDRQTCTLELISLSTGGVKGNEDSQSPDLSVDGRYVVFDSFADNLVLGDTNTSVDVFVRDRQTGITTRVSTGSGGVQGASSSADPSISADGRYVAFESFSSNLVTGDTNSVYDVFLHDRNTGTTTRQSVATGGAQGTGGASVAASISADGRYVAFQSSATNLVTSDTNAQIDIFVRDTASGITTRVSVATGGTQGTGTSGSSLPKLSSDGRYVAFESYFTNLVANDTNNQRDIFVHDRLTTVTTRVSVATGGVQATNIFNTPDISNDGRFVVFSSPSTNVITGDTNGLTDIFVHDRQTTTTTRVSVMSDGGQATGGSSFAPAISADGQLVAFSSDATNLVVGDTNAVEDIFVAPRIQPTGDTLALFNPPFQFVALVDTLTDNPAAINFTAFSTYPAPATPGQWVMGDWNGDGLDTPGVYASGVFSYTNTAGETQRSDWRNLWIGVGGPPVAGRFDGAAANDCIGAVQSANFAPFGTAFVFYFTCDLSGNTAPAILFQWLSVVLPDSGGFTGTHQFGAGDFDADGLDSLAIRRGSSIAFGNVAPAIGPAAFDLAQFIGAPQPGSDEGLFLVGDWDGLGYDTFGLFYQNGEFFYRNDYLFNSGVYGNQSVGTPFGSSGVQVAAWR